MPTQTSKYSSFDIAPLSNQRGATLIEAMVSLFVFAVGALGIAAMQTTSLVRVDDTKQRSLAIWKAQELTDRMRNTKTFVDPDGLLPEFLAAINNDDDGIGVFDSDDVYPCDQANPPTRCDDTSGNNVAACTAAEFVTFEVWSVMCDPSSGIAGSQGDGSIGLRNVELAMVTDGGGYRLYIEWLSRSANANEALQTENADGETATIATSLCGEDDVPVDSRLDAYCVRFQ